MIPFPISLRTGAPISEQVVYAARKAVIGGVLRPGDKFPSIRVLSQSLKINPNTAQKIISQLTQEGLLEVHPGIGTIVGKSLPATPKQRSQLLGDQLERLVVEARQLDLPVEEVVEALREHWKRFS